MTRNCKQCEQATPAPGNNRRTCGLDRKTRDGSARRTCAQFSPSKEAAAPKKYLVKINGQLRWVDAEAHAELLKHYHRVQNERYCSKTDKIIHREDCDACTGTKVDDNHRCEYRLGRGLKPTEEQIRAAAIAATKEIK